MHCKHFLSNHTNPEYVNSGSASGRGGYVFSGIFIILGSLFMFFIKVHKSHLRHKRKMRRDCSESRGKHRRVMADTISIAPDGTLLGISGVPLPIPTSPESNGNFNNSGVFADAGVSRSGAGSMSRGSHNEPDEILFPPQFLQVLFDIFNFFPYILQKIFR